MPSGSVISVSALTFIGAMVPVPPLASKETVNSLAVSLPDPLPPSSGPGSGVGGGHEINNEIKNPRIKNDFFINNSL